MLLPFHRFRHPSRACLWLAAGMLCAGGGFAHGAEPTGEQQFWLELINRMRVTPAAELDQLVNFSAPGVWASPKSDDPDVAAALDFYGVDAATLTAQWSGLVAAPALAWSDALNASAAAYSNVMVGEDQQAHDLDGLSLDQRIEAGGYSGNWLELGESLFATAASSFHGHAALAVDWGLGANGIQSPPTHRQALMDALFKEVGIGFQTVAIPGSNTEATGPLVVTHHFASRFRMAGANVVSDAILTGVVYADTIAADVFYTPGEGWAGTAINIYEDASNTLVAAGFTNAAGGFNIPLTGLTDGIVYRVEAPDTGLPGQTFSLSSHVEDYGVPVIVYDNAYASFQAVPEPNAALLVVLAAGVAAAIRRRPRAGCRRGRVSDSSYE